MDKEDYSLLNKALKYWNKENGEKELQVIMEAPNRVSPGYISELDEKEVIVVGGNVNGTFYWRACGMAHEEFGLELGKPDCLSGQAYAISTTKYPKDGEPVAWNRYNKEEWENILDKLDPKGFPKLKTDEIEQYVNKFIETARKHPDKKFLVTRIGCGKVGYDDETIAKMFKDALKLDNVYLPQSFIDCLFETDKIEGTPSDMIPSADRGVENFQKDLEHQLSKYLAWLRTNKEKLGENRLDVLDSAEKICSGISKAVTMMYKGLPAEAYSAIKAIMDDNILKINKKNYTGTNHENLLKSLTAVTDHQNFYRLRVENDNWKKKEIDKKGMFHIALSLRGMIKTQRYSISGYPCLYLGKRIKSCWEELGRANLGNCMISRFRNEKPFYVLDLSIPESEFWRKDLSTDKANRTILMFPLIIACTFKAHDNNAAFKPEYIVPQLLLQYVKELAYNYNKQYKDDKSVFGIKYTSVTIPKENRELDMYENYVIPVTDVKHELCSTMTQLFTLTEPVCEEYVRLRYVKNKENDKDDVFKFLEGLLNDEPTTEL